MSNPLSQPHDKFFKETFGNLEVATAFLVKHLPASILEIADLETLEAQKDSFISSQLEETFSDLVFKCRVKGHEAYICFLFEHKSYPDKYTALQVLGYMVSLWDAKVNKEKSDKLPLVIPLVIYHGEEQWNVKNTLSSLIEGYEKLPAETHKYVPNYEYLLQDLSQYNEQEIEEVSLLNTILRAMNDTRKPDRTRILVLMETAISGLNKILPDSEYMYFIEVIIRYIISVRDDIDEKDLIDLSERLPEGSDILMTLAQRLEAKGEARGIAKGRAEGKAEGRAEMIIRLYKRGTPIKDLAEVAEIPIQEVEKIIKGEE